MLENSIDRFERFKSNCDGHVIIMFLKDEYFRYEIPESQSRDLDFFWKIARVFEFFEFEIFESKINFFEFLFTFFEKKDFISSRLPSLLSSMRLTEDFKREWIAYDYIVLKNWSVKKARTSFKFKYYFFFG